MRHRTFINLIFSSINKLVRKTNIHRKAVQCPPQSKHLSRSTESPLPLPRPWLPTPEPHASCPSMPHTYPKLSWKKGVILEYLPCVNYILKIIVIVRYSYRLFTNLFVKRKVQLVSKFSRNCFLKRCKQNFLRKKL